MFIPFETHELGIGRADLEERTVVEIHVLPVREGDVEGGFTSRSSRDELLRDKIVSLPHCAISEFRQYETLMYRYACAYQAVAASGHQYWRLAIMTHVLNAHDDDALREVQLISKTIHCCGRFSVADLSSFVETVRALVSTIWNGICAGVAHLDVVVKEFGRSTPDLHSQYLDLLKNNPKQETGRSAYLLWLGETLRKRPTDIEILSLAAQSSHPTMRDLSRAVLYARHRDQDVSFSLLEARRRSAHQALDFVVDEGRAEFFADRTTRATYEIPSPIVPLPPRGDQKEFTTAGDGLDPNNPYRRGFLLLKQIAARLGQAYPDIACELASTPGRILTNMLLVDLMSKIPESSPCHPVWRLTRIAHLDHAEGESIKRSPPGYRLIALASLVDKELPPLYQYALELINATESANEDRR